MENVYVKLKKQKFYLLFIHKKILIFLIISIILSFIILLYIFSNIKYIFTSNHLSSGLIINKRNNLRNLKQENNLTNINNSYDYNNNENNTNNTFDLIFRVKPLKTNVTKKAIYYNFIKSITSGYYSGNWSDLSVTNNRFKDKNGEAYLFFNKKDDINYLLNIDENYNNSKIKLTFFIKDGKYFDDSIRVNFTFGFEDISTIDLNNGIITFILSNVTISYRWLKFYQFENIKHLNNSYINLTFYKKFMTFENYINYQSISNDYGNMSLEIKNYCFRENINANNSNYTFEKYFEIYFKGLAIGSDDYSIDDLNYSIFISVFCIIEIYLLSPLYFSLRTNSQLALNTDICTLLVQYLWILLLNMENLFLLFLEKKYLYEYFVPFFFYFIYTLIIQDYLLFAWKSRYNRNIINNRRALIKKYLIFVTINHSIIYGVLLKIKCWYSNSFYTFILYSLLWIGQIIYSIKKGTKPPMSYSYILFSSFSKLSICFYVKVYKNNIYNYRQNYLTMFSVSIIVIIEVIIICLQKFLGPKFIIPKRFRKKGYNYYRNENDITQNDKENVCVICLDKIENNNIIQEAENRNNIKRNLLIKILIKYLEKLKNKEKNKGIYMITPCNHIYHAKCLELWLNVKNQLF